MTKIKSRAEQEAEIRWMLHSEIVFGVGIAALITSSILNPYLVSWPTSHFVAVVMLISLVFGALFIVKNTVSLKLLSLVYIALVSLGFRLQIDEMGEFGKYWVGTISVEIILATMFVFNTKTDYVLGCLLVISFMLIGQPLSYFTSVSWVLLSLCLITSVLIGIFLNSGAMSCIREIYAARERFRVLSNTDPLTGLRNRRSFLECLERALENQLSQSFFFAMIDIDDFKQINDRYGHDMGDAILCRLASLARECLPTGTEIGRLGGEEFGVLLKSETPADAHARLASLLFLSQQTEADSVSLSFSAGLALVSPADSLSTLLRRADVGLYLAKRSGKSRIEWSD
ncbi:GGDEF domain-containing protein [Agrobacterium rosae]|uniref:GGDEF domain-containing protein n=1 Tax=Agrobacterium rosae TaxID=1972867 RepID=UPI0019D3BBAE|nr:GGDEF domain-containing protein [Agrobacterium rosae]MBN7808382.1 GGDEF domain-containing protein [Agrobacterium rosae]